MAKYRKLGRTSDQRKALIRNQVTALLYNGKIVTTEAKAKEVRKVAEGLIALAVKEKDNFEMVDVKVVKAKRDSKGNKLTEVAKSKNGKEYLKVVKEEKIEKIQIKDEPAGFDCDICGHPMVIKLGKYGKFYACSNFPDCRNTKPIVKEIGVTCPVCHEGQVIERKSKKNRIFYGCSRFPDCDFTSWDKPVGRNCPKCDQYLVEKKVKGGKQVVCINGDYEEDIQK